MKTSVPVSVGELIDKLTILELKISNIANKSKLRYVREEFADLSITLYSLNLVGVSLFYNKLLQINQELWDIEDRIRVLEKEQDFGEEFIFTARQVYKVNDKRSELKRKLDEKYDSSFVETKSYEDYE